MLSNEAIARVTHEANRALQYELGEPCPSDPWDAASAETRKSAQRGVILARQQTRIHPYCSEHDQPLEWCAHYRLNMARKQHDAWADHKLGEGWHWGPVRNEVEKTHPNLVPYDQLPAEEKLKDELFLSIVSVLASGS